MVFTLSSEITEQSVTYVGHIMERLSIFLAFQAIHEALAGVGVFVLGWEQSEGDRNGRCIFGVYHGGVGRDSSDECRGGSGCNGCDLYESEPSKPSKSYQ